MNTGDISLETFIAGVPTDDVRMKYFRCIEQECAPLTPERIGNFEPVQTPFNNENARSLWRNIFIWVAPKAGATGMVFWANPAYGEEVSRLSIHIRPGRQRLPSGSLERLSRSLFSVLDVEYQFLHRVKSCDLNRGRLNQTLHAYGKRQRLDVPTYYLEFWLPDLFDINFFGHRYCSLFADNLLGECVAGTIEHISRDQAILDFKSFSSESEAAAIEFEQKREKTKVCLGEEAFFRQGDRVGIRKRSPFPGKM